MRIYNNYNLEKKTSYSSSNKRLVYLMYGYNESKVNYDKFSRKFSNLTRQDNNKKNSPKWLNNLINYFNIIDDSVMPAPNTITESEFRYHVMKTLNNLKNQNKYVKIIKKDYNNYLK